LLPPFGFFSPLFSNPKRGGPPDQPIDRQSDNLTIRFPMRHDLEILPLAAPLRHEIETRLRSAITQGRFHAGERLIERELCEMLGVSRPSLREALRQLEAEQLVTLRPNRGPVVAEITIEEATEIYEIRATLEGQAARLFTRRASPEEVQNLRQTVQDLKRAERASSSGLLLDRKNKFYLVLLNGCRNRVIQRVLTQLHNRIRLLRAETLAGRTKAAFVEIEKIVKAIETRDEEAAYRAGAAHIERAAQFALASLQKRQRTSREAIPHKKERKDDRRYAAAAAD
jgi:GntR family transcriptional regulator, trigonelline degradation regulator